jgi:hypothetical protein
MQRHPININWLLPALMSGMWLVAAPVTAETYKWTDAEGKVHYSDQPPPANAKEQVIVKPRKSSAPTAAPAPTEKGTPAAKEKTNAEQEAEFRKRQVEAAEREAAEKKKADEAAERKQNCQQVNTQLQGLQAGARVTRTNAQGELEYMSDAQIEQEIERLKKASESLCK